MAKFTRHFLASTSICLTWVATSYASTIAWPTMETSPGSLPAHELLGPPATNVVTFSHTSVATFSEFSNEVTYDTSALISAFDVTPAVWSTVEFVAFEQNTTSPGFETTEWEFNDGLNVITHRHNFGDPGPSGPVIKNGNMTSAAFNAIFGTNFHPSNTVGFLLFGVTLVPDESAVDASTMDVRLVGGGINANFQWPEVIALGVVRTIPEPSTCILLLLGMATMRFHRDMFRPCSTRS